jgi:5-methyltetrahydrofolate--homocysteine methyltransferase
LEIKVSSAKKEVIIAITRPTVLIGEPINPTGKKKLAEALKSCDLEVVRAEAMAQVQVLANSDQVELTGVSLWAAVAQ